MEKVEQKPVKKSVTVWLITTSLLLSLALFACGIYSLYISIGFRFLQRSGMQGVNTSALYTYSNSVYGTGGERMVGLILVSIVMLGLGVGMAVIFFKQLPLYKQIKLLAKLPNVKDKNYSVQTKKGVVAISIIAYVICIAFSIFAIFVALTSGISANYVWIVVVAFAVVLTLSVASLVLMIIKIVQLKKLRNMFNSATNLQENKDIKEEKPQNDGQKDEDSQKEDAQAAENANKNADKPQTLAQEQPQTTMPFAQVAYMLPNGQWVLAGAQSVVPSSIEIFGGVAPNVYAPNMQPTMPAQTQKNSGIEQNVEKTDKEKEPTPHRLFSDGIFELSGQLQKLREMHVSGLIDGEEYQIIREKWIDAVVSEPLFPKTKKPKAKTKDAAVDSGNIIS
jgi:hypothetical protein